MARRGRTSTSCCTGWVVPRREVGPGSHTPIRSEAPQKGSSARAKPLTERLSPFKTLR